jgi:hypothetical protein
VGSGLCGARAPAGLRAGKPTGTLCAGLREGRGGPDGERGLRPGLCRDGEVLLLGPRDPIGEIVSQNRPNCKLLRIGAPKAGGRPQEFQARGPAARSRGGGGTGESRRIMAIIKGFYPDDNKRPACRRVSGTGGRGRERRICRSHQPDSAAAGALPEERGQALLAEPRFGREILGSREGAG